MILKRPSGNMPETPTQLQQRLLKKWDAQVRDYLATKQASDTKAWPLEVNIGQPRLTSDALINDVVIIRDWMDSWVAIETKENICFSEKKRRKVGQMRIPEKIIFSDIDHLAAFLGKIAQSDLSVARSRFEDLIALDPRLIGMARNWKAITTLSEQEHLGIYDFIKQRKFSAKGKRFIREMLIEGLDGKFLERNHVILEDALSHIGLLSEGNDYRERLGFQTEDRQTLWVKTHPGDMTGPFGSHQFAVRPSRIRALPTSIHKVVIVENVETFFAYDPEPGVCLFFGSGNAIVGMAKNMPFLTDIPVLYWGDLDSFGMKILSRLRQIVPNVISVLMDTHTMTGIARDAWRSEPESDRYTGDIEYLTPQEQGALDIIRSGNYRVEQEHLEPSEKTLKTLGLQYSCPHFPGNHSPD